MNPISIACLRHRDWLRDTYLPWKTIVMAASVSRPVDLPGQSADAGYLIVWKVRCGMSMPIRQPISAKDHYRPSGMASSAEVARFHA